MTEKLWDVSPVSLHAFLSKFFLLVFLWVGLNVYVYTKEVEGEIDDYFHDDVDVDSCNCDDSDISTYLITIFLSSLSLLL